MKKKGNQKKPISLPRLGVNIDHIATLRQLRKTPYPLLTHAAFLAIKGGASQITVHLREDRRHIQDQDVIDLSKALSKTNAVLNLEMAATLEMMEFAIKVKPEWVCLVPEKREEVTTEGGLDLLGHYTRIEKVIKKLRQNGVKVSLFIEPEKQAVFISKKLKADAVELHTGQFCIETQKVKPLLKKINFERDRIIQAIAAGKKAKIHVHAGHGIDYSNIRLLCDLEIEEYNIGHSIICRSTEVGLQQAVAEMHSAMLAP